MEAVEPHLLLLRPRRASLLLPPVSQATRGARPRGREAPPQVDAVVHLAAFRAALRSFLRESERVAQANGLTPQRHLLLLMIKGAPDRSEQATITELTDRLQLAQSSVTELVKRAERVGLIERKQSDLDARVTHLRLTAEGERRFARVFTYLEVEREQLQAAVGELDRGSGETAPAA